MNWREHDRLLHLIQFRSGKRFGVASAILAISYLSCVSIADAGVAVSPLQQQIEVKPGRQAEFTISLNNVRRSQQQKPQMLRLEVVDFSVSLDGTLAFGEGQGGERSAVKWTTLDTNELTLAPGESRRIKGKISAPFSADGDYWCAVMMNHVTPKSDEGVNVALRTACGVFIRVARRNYLGRLAIENSEMSLPQIELEDNMTSPRVNSENEQPTSGEDLGGGLRVFADVTNEGCVSCTASGTASIYSDSWRRVAFIPMHSRRRRILPGHTRRFTGAMSAPLPPGDYILRFTFGSDSGRSRTAMKETRFQVNAAMARQWKEHCKRTEVSSLLIEPGKLQRDLTAGRYSPVFLSVSNDNPSTLRVRCRLVADSVPAEWIQASPTDFTLAPGMRRSIVCHIRIPKTADPGKYEGIILIESESAGLVEQSVTKTRKIPVSISVSPTSVPIVRGETIL